MHGFYSPNYMISSIYCITISYHNIVCMKLHYKWQISVYCVCVCVCVCGGDYMSMGCVCMVADNLIKSPHTTASIDIALTLTTLK